MPDSPLSLLSLLYVVGALAGGAAFLIMAMVAPHVTRHYFEHEIRDQPGSPWAKFFISLCMLSVLWPITLLIRVTQPWWAKSQKRMDTHQENP